jgi:prepilin-type N-terminal cleavage/methylation domain-containing protein
MTRHIRPVDRREGGFSLIELLVAMVIATVFFAVAVPMFVQAMRASAQDRTRVLALNAAQDRIEKIHQLAYNQVEADKLHPELTPNLYNSDFANEQFGPTWKVKTAAGTRLLTVDYVVAPHAAVSGHSAAYKQVTITALWTTSSQGGPQQHSVVLSTIVYAQFAGPQITTFVVGPIISDLITSTSVTLTATINSGDLQAMLPATINGTTLSGYVTFKISSASGGASAKTITVLYNDTATYTTTWLAPGGTGVADGFYTFEATAYSTTDYAGNSWQISKRIETGGPPAVTDLSAFGSSTAGGVEVSWTGVTANDLDHYVVMRTLGATTTVAPKLSVGSTAYTDVTAVANLDYTYTVTAVDALDNPNLTPATTGVQWVAPGAPPNPAQSLQGSQPTSYYNNIALSWLAPATIPGITVNGYHVYAAGGPHALTGELVDTVSSGTNDNSLTQPWNSTVYYQVKAVSSTLSESSNWASIATTAPAQTTGLVGAAPWIKITLGAEPLYTLNVTNNVANKTTFTLWYRGPSGTGTAVEVGSGQYAKKTGDVVKWTGLHAGSASNSYELRWGGSSGVADGPISGANLTVSVAVPVSSPW